MATDLNRHIRKSDWPLMVFSAAVLGIYLFYTISFIVQAPYPGIVFTQVSDGWLVNDSTQENVEIDDVLVQIGDLTFEEFVSDRWRVPFSGYAPGETVSPILTKDGRDIDLIIQASTLQDRLRRLFSTLWFFPFWVAGTAVLLFVRRRDNIWRLLTAMMYTSGLWAALGGIANWHIGGSSLVLSILQWVMVPVYLHLHLTVPGSLFGRFGRLLIRPLYILSFVALAADLAMITPTVLALYALVIAVLSSFGMLLIRAIGRKTAPSDKLAARLMLAGTGLAFGPGVLHVSITSALDIAVPSAVGVALATIALPLLPISYTYATYKRHLGEHEFRANRLITVYGFALVIPTIFILAFLFGEQSIESAAGRTFYLLTVSVIFALATPPLLNRFQRAINRLAYGAVHNPDEVLQLFARRIPSALKREVLTDLLKDEIAPSLLIRQSALYLFTADGVDIAYSSGVPESDIQISKGVLEAFARSSGSYLPPESPDDRTGDWVRLPLSLITREKSIGVWLLGRRDPDDFYPKNDIELLQTIANQVAPVVENIRLYETLQEHADNLAEEVSMQTAELQSEKDRTQAVLDSAGEGVFFTDNGGNVLYANPAMASLSGYDAGELSGKGLELWLSTEEKPENYSEMISALQGGQAWGGELLLRCKNQAPVNVNLTLAPICSSNGSITGFVGVQSDISKLKEVDRLKSNIISSVSHELKTPLTTIKTYLMLMRHGRREKHESYLTVLDRETDRLTTIIVDLLDLSALDTGKIPTQFKAVDSKTAIQQAIEICQPRAEEHRISLQMNVQEGTPLVFADASQINQVLTNLLINAIHYSPEGAGVEIGSGIGRLNGSNAVWISVKDAGPGIENNDLPHLFDRFYRGKAARDSSAPGTGLGLAICREIVARHHGKIEASNNSDQGATFTVWLQAMNPVTNIAQEPVLEQHAN